MRSSRRLRACFIEAVGEAVLLELVDDVAAAREIADQDALAVADEFRLDVLVGGRILQHRADVNAALVREGALADEWLVVAQRQIGQIGDEARHAVSPASRRGRSVSWPSFSSRLAMMLTRLALPQRSP